jgi:RNA polymerase sigma-70 factor (ECF subfamily)
MSVHSKESSLQAAFEAVALSHFDAVYRAARQMTRTADEAQELVQETYYKAYRAFHRYKPGTRPKTWLLTILQHTSIDAWRRAVRRPEVVDSALVETIETHVAPSSEELLERHTVEERLRHAVHEAVDALPESFRQAVVLADFEDHSYKEIATLVGCPEGTVMSRLFRGRRLLRERLRAVAREHGYTQAMSDEPETPPHTGAGRSRDRPRRRVDVATPRERVGRRKRTWRGHRLVPHNRA